MNEEILEQAPSSPSGHLPQNGGGKDPHFCQACEPGAPLGGELAFAKQMTEGGIPKSHSHRFILALLPPLFLSFLFYALKSNTPLMDAWVHQYMAPVMQAVGGFWSLFPFSVAEIFIALFLVGSFLWLVRALLLFFKKREWKSFLTRMLAFGCVLAWLWAIFCWTWNCTYYATGFAAKNGLSKDPYTPEQLLQVTVYFAVQTARLSTQVPRNDDLSFAKPLSECFEEGTAVYDNLCTVYPTLSLPTGRQNPSSAPVYRVFWAIRGCTSPSPGRPT